MVIQLPQPSNLSRLRYLHLAKSNALAQGIELPKNLKAELHTEAMKRIRAKADKLKW